VADLDDGFHKRETKLLGKSPRELRNQSGMAKRWNRCDPARRRGWLPLSHELRSCHNELIAKPPGLPLVLRHHRSPARIAVAREGPANLGTALGGDVASHRSRPALSRFERDGAGADEVHGTLHEFVRADQGEASLRADRAATARRGLRIVQLGEQALHQALLAPGVVLHRLLLDAPQRRDPFDALVVVSPRTTRGRPAAVGAFDGSVDLDLLEHRFEPAVPDVHLAFDRRQAQGLICGCNDLEYRPHLFLGRERDIDEVVLDLAVLKPPEQDRMRFVELPAGAPHLLVVRDG
jgi:hypothetical protein